MAVASPAEEGRPGAASAHLAAEKAKHRPRNIWRSLHEQHRLDIAAFRGPLAQAGCFLVPATVWPAPRLPRGTAALSRSLAGSLGRPDDGAMLQLYAWPGTPQPFSGQTSPTASPPLATEVFLWQCISCETGEQITLGATSMQGSRTAGPVSTQAPASSFSKGKAPDDAKQHGTAEEAAKRHLAGRVLLSGNPVLLPVPGMQALFAVSEAWIGAAMTSSASSWQAAKVSKDTAVKVLRHDQIPVHPGASPKLAALQDMSAGEAAAVAAAKAVGGGPAGPAAVAAKRAALLGAAALQRGCSGLGGVAEHMTALREHVALPLQA